MKKTLAESKIIRFYMMLWFLFIIGILIVLPFSQTKSGLRFIALAGFLLSAGSFLSALGLLLPVQAEIKARYAAAADGEKRFLTTVFYFARGIFILAGGLFFGLSSFRQAVLPKDLVEVSGKILSIYMTEQKNESLKIRLENNPNEYGIHTFQIPENKLPQIESELQPGVMIIFLIRREDEKAINDKSIQIYGIKTETYNLLTLADYNTAVLTNNWCGYGLGIIFAGYGFIYVLTGRIKPNHQTQVSDS